MSMEKEYLARESDIEDYDSYVSANFGFAESDFLKKEIIDNVENIINEKKDSFYALVCDVKSCHFDFPPEMIYQSLDLLFEEIKEKIFKISSPLNQNK